MSLPRGFIALSIAIAVALAAGCESAVEDPATGGDSGSTSSDSTGAQETDRTESSDGSGSASQSETGPPPVLPGIVVEDAVHSYQCIDGCESFYSDESLTVTITADQASLATVELQDWTLGDRTLVSDDDPIMETEVQLEAGVATEVELRNSETGFCSMENWSEPARILLLIDGIAIEVEGRSSAGSGFDC